MLVCNHENVFASLRKKLEDVEAEKGAMLHQINDQQQMLEELKGALENAKGALEEREHVHNTERTQLMTEVSNLQKEVAKLATSAVVREKESLRKDLEKMKLKLKDTESKLRNILQEKSKLEAEKANTDRETKVLREQTSLLQRGMYKRESLADKRRESKAFDLSKTKNQLGCVELSLQSKIIESERATFDVDVLRGKLAALENDLFVADEERETLAYELEIALEKMELTSLELNSLQEKHAELAEQFHEREAICKQLEDSVSALLKEKEEMAMQAVDASLRLEEEKAVFSAREKSAVEAVKEEGDKMLRNVETEVNLLKEDLHKGKLNLIKEKTKLEVRLAWTKAKLDAFGDRYLEEVEAKTQMHRRYVEDSRKLKEQLVATSLECFDLKKQLMGIELPPRI